MDFLIQEACFTKNDIFCNFLPASFLSWFIDINPPNVFSRSNPRTTGYHVLHYHTSLSTIFMCIVNESKKQNVFILACVRDLKYNICFNCFYLRFKSKIDLGSVYVTKLCFGSFFWNAVRFLFVYLSIYNNPSDRDAYSLGFQQSPAKNDSTSDWPR